VFQAAAAIEPGRPDLSSYARLSAAKRRPTVVIIFFTHCDSSKILKTSLVSLICEFSQILSRISSLSSLECSIITLRVLPIALLNYDIPSERLPAASPKNSIK
jgi:hypothetical protein